MGADAPTCVHQLPRPNSSSQVSIGGNQIEGNLYPFADVQPQNVNVSSAEPLCGSIPDIASAAAFHT